MSLARILVVEDDWFDLAWRGTGARSPAPDSGAGLGLAIVRGVAEAHRGSVRVMNTGDGCCFEMRLPACLGKGSSGGEAAQTPRS